VEVTITISDEVIAAAKARGLRVEDYVKELLQEQLSPRTARTTIARTPEEIRSWLDSLAQYSEKIPALPETISRDWIYQDHS
jgi:hypothetical protein